MGLRISIAMHVALLIALGTGEQRSEQKVEAQEVELVVLPTQIPEGDGRSPSEADDNCSDRQQRPSPEVAIFLDIAEGPLSASLHALSQQTGLAYAAEAALLENKHSSALHGLFTPRDAVDRVLAGTGLCSHWIEGSIVIRRCAVAFHDKSKRPSFGASGKALAPCDSGDPATVPEPRPLPRTSIAQGQLPNRGVMLERAFAASPPEREDQVALVALQP